MAQFIQQSLLKVRDECHLGFDDQDVLENVELPFEESIRSFDSNLVPDMVIFDFLEDPCEDFDEIDAVILNEDPIQ